MIESDLAQYLTADEDLSALVLARVYPTRIPPKKNITPAVTYFLVSDDQKYSMDGEGGLARKRFQFNCWAPTYAVAKEIAAAVKTLLSGFSGTMGESDVQGIFLQDQADIQSPQNSVDKDTPYGVRQDYLVCHAT